MGPEDVVIAEAELGPVGITDQSSSDDSIEPPPDGGYGWVIVASCATINGFTWGVSASYGVYLAYYLDTNTFPGAQDIDFALIGGFQFFMALLMAPLVTILARNFNIHLPMLLGVIFQTAAYVLASFAKKIWHLYLTQGVLVGIGLGFIWLPSVPVLSQWWEKRRSFANGITSAGSGIGGIIFSFTTQRMIDHVGLGWSLRIIGLVSGIMNLLATILLRSRNQIIKPTQHGFDIKLLRRYDVLLLLGWLFVGLLGYIVILYSYSDFAHAIGLNKERAAEMSGFLNLGTTLGRPLTGLLSDRYGRIETAGFITFICGISIFAIWIPDHSYGLTVFYAIFVGAMLGVFWVTIAPVAVVVVGLVELPSMLSICWIVAALPTLFSEVIALKLRSGGSRPYLHPQIFAGLSYLIASVLMLELWRVNRKKLKSRATI